MRQIIHSKKYGEIVFEIDEQDLQIIKEYKLRASKSKKDTGFYVKCRFRGKEPTISLHNLLMGEKFIDHIDGNPLNNSRSNLRKTDYFGNNANARKRKDFKYSHFKGVTKFKNSWKARIQSNGERITIGTYKTEAEAAEAYNQKAKELHGQFARLNKKSA